MCLHPRPVEPIPEETIRVARAAFPKPTTAMVMRDELGAIFEDEDFALLFPERGKPAFSPWRLALITILQFAENLSDRQAADAVRGRLDWKYCLSLELTDPGFDSSVLCEFRARLLEGGAEEILFEGLLTRFREMRLLGARGRQRTDSTHVLASVRNLSRLELVGEALRLALNALSSAAPQWLKDRVPPEWSYRYARPFNDLHLPRGQQRRHEEAESIGRDGYELFNIINSADSPAWLRQIPAVETLRRVWLQNYVNAEEGLIWRQSSTEGLPPASIRIDSPTDPESRFSKKRSIVWLGYKIHTTETCDDGLPRLIVNVGTSAASTSDRRVLASVHGELETNGLLPSIHLVDASYIDSTAMIDSLQHHGVDLLGPMRSNYQWQQREGKGFDLENFEIDWEREEVTCPEGRKSLWWKPYKDPNGRPIVRVRFARTDCIACPSNELCVRPRKTQDPRRLLKIPSKERYEALRTARKREETEWYLKEYARRDGIEGTISRAVRTCGIRRSRYRGQAKVHLGHLLTATAVNFVRVGEWFSDTPRSPARISPFVRLMQASAA